MDDDVKVLTPQQAYSMGIAQRKVTVMLLGICGAIGLSVGVFSLLGEPHFNWLDGSILVVMLVAYLTLTFLLLVSPERSLHLVLLGWVLIAAIGIGALVISAYIGAPGQYILQNQVPWFIGWTPVVVIFAFTYLPIRTAQVVSIAYCVVTALASILFIVYSLPLEEGESLIASIWMLMQFAMLNPLCVILLSLLVRLNSEAVTMVQESNLRVEEARLQTEKAQQTDDLTQAFNRAGIDVQLQHDIDALAPDQVLLVVAVTNENFHEIVDTKGEEVGDALVREIYYFLIDALGPATRIGRREGCHFTLWSEPLPMQDFESRVNRIYDSLQRHHFDATDSRLEFCVGATIARHHQQEHFVLEQANFNLFLARSRESGMLFSESGTESQT